MKQEYDFWSSALKLIQTGFQLQTLLLRDLAKLAHFTGTQQIQMAEFCQPYAHTSVSNEAWA